MFKIKKAFYKANSDDAKVVNLTAEGDFDNSSKVIFNVEVVDNSYFDVKYISVEIVEDKMVVLTERGNELSGTEGISLFLKNWYVSEYEYYLKNCQINHFVTTNSSIKSEVTVLNDEDPYKFLFKFPKNVIDDNSLKSLILTLKSGEFYLEYVDTEGKEIFGIIESQIKSFVKDLIKRINNLKKHKE